MKKPVSVWKYILTGSLTLGILFAVIVSPAAQAQQATGGDVCGKETFLGFPAWYKGLTKANNASCDVVAPSEVGGMSKFAWIIALNVVEMILRAAGYAAAAFIIYGGYKYMISAGSPDGMVGARKTIMNAAIGLVLSIAAVAIVNTISSGLKIG
jgi:hypothetical protein